MLLRLPQLILGLLFLLFAVSCEKNDNSVATPRTVTDLILEDDRFTLLRVAMLHAGMGDALKATNLTLFAPSDSAFVAVGITSPGAILAQSPQQIRNVLLYHVLASPVSSSALPPGQNAVSTADSGVVYVNKTSAGGLTVNSARVTQADISVANGTVHVIDRLLTPSATSVLAAVQSNPNLQLLSAALRRVGTTNSALAALGNPSGTGVTVFAPSDAAFRSAGYASVAAVEAASPQTLTSLLTYHVLPNVLLSGQIETGPVNTLSSGNRLTLAVTNGVATVKGAKNATSATIVTPDLVAPNGVVHVINQVLLP